MEMNAHLPQSYEAMVELEEIAAVPNHIITPRHAKPVIGIFQDTLVGTYRLTHPNEFTRKEYMNLMMWNKRFDGNLQTPRGGSENKPRWTGQQVLTSLLPPLNIDMGNKAFDSDKENNTSKNYVKIKQGDVLQGIVDGDVYMKPSKGIIHTTYNDYGPKDTVELIDSLQNTVEHFLVLNGFSVGISDLVADTVTKQRIEEIIAKQKKEVEQKALEVHLDLFENNTGKTNQQEFEDQTFAILNKATADAGKSGEESLSSENRLVAMVKSGSKGDQVNIAQMIACLGQQAIDGKRIAYGFTDRTLPHYKKYDDGAEARGFIESSFIRGLTPQEFFFHAMSGREGLIDTAVKTADTGYLQRQLIKAMEDLTVQHDGSVRDANMNIFQFHYGEDGIAATKIETQSIGLAKLSQDEIRKEFGMMEVDWAAILQPGTIREENNELIQQYVEDVLYDQEMLVEGVFKNSSLDSGSVFAPANIARLINNIKIRFNISSKEPTDLTPEYVLNGIQKIVNNTSTYHKIWIALLRFHCAPHKLIVKERFTKIAFDTLCEILVLKHMQAWVQPGEQVGIVAAQSIGEPSTQMSASNTTYITAKCGENKVFSGQIGEFIDQIIKENSKDVVTIGENSVVLDLKNDYYIVGVSEDEKVSWKRISQVSRHPANGGLVEVHTRSGRKTTATLSHSFLKRDTFGIVPVLGSDLKVGMRIPVAREIPEIPNPLTEYTHNETIFKLNKQFGWLCGAYLADGCINGNYVKITKVIPIFEEIITDICTQYGWKFSTRKYDGEYGPGKDNNIRSRDLASFLTETFKTGSFDKEIGALVYHSNKEFIAGVISGYFDGDGNVNVPRQMIRASSRSKKLIQDIARLLGYTGVFATICEEKSVNYPGQVQYTLQIIKKHAKLFKERIGLSVPEKAEGIDEIIQYNDRDDKYTSHEQIDKIPELGEVIAQTGKLLKMPGQSRNFGRWAKKDSIGRATLEKYVVQFEQKMAEEEIDYEIREQVNMNMGILKSALYSDVIWDEIIELNYLPDPKEFVYDFTVPGNDSFMVDENILVHNTLNTFHQAGVASKSSVTRGVPRLRELLKVTKNPKATSLTMYLKPEFRQNKEKAREVVQDLELTLLKNITKKVAIYWDPNEGSSVIEEDRELLEFYRLFEQGMSENQIETSESNKSKWVLRLELNREEMFNRNISMQDIAFVINNAFSNEISVVYSDYNSQKLVMRIRLDGVKENIKAREQLLDDFTNLKKFQTKLLNSIVIRGIPGIKAVTFRKDKQKVIMQNGKYEELEQYILDTDGTNFVKVMNHPAIDGTKLYSTNVHDVFEVLGTEATREILYSEIAGLFSSVGVNYRHLGLLCDVMTRSGKLMSIDRYGINKNDIGPLAKASFEETGKIMLKASMFGEVDPVTGVSANIMVGQTIRGGTAFSQVLLDEAAMMQLYKDTEIDEDEQEETANIIDLLEEGTRLNDPCATSNFQMNMTMPKASLVIEEEDVEVNIIE